MGDYLFDSISRGKLAAMICSAHTRVVLAAPIHPSCSRTPGRKTERISLKTDVLSAVLEQFPVVLLWCFQFYR
jgi:hypothetical protein